MAIREDVVQSAVKFLKDPKVQQAPLARRVAFLESKGLTAEEVEEAMSRSGGSGSTTSGSATTAPAPSTQQPAQPAPYNPNAPYPQQPYYPQQPGYPVGPYPLYPYPHPPQPGMPQQPFPHPSDVKPRDWRDYTLAGIGALAGAYVVGLAVKNWLLPYLSSPGAAVLTEDRKLITENLSTTSTALTAVQSETAVVIKAVEEQSEKVTQALEQIEKALRDVKDADSKREDEVKALKDDMENIKTMIPKMVEKQKENHSTVLADLQTEIKSLKSLLLNRRIGPVGGDDGAAPDGTSGMPPAGGYGVGSSTSKYLQAKPQIPAWQLEQQKRAEEAAKKRETSDGQAAVGDG